MARTFKFERRVPQERDLSYSPTPEPEVDEVTAARLKRDFPIEDYPGITRKDLVVTPGGRVLIRRRPGDSLIII